MADEQRAFSAPLPPDDTPSGYFYAGASSLAEQLDSEQRACGSGGHFCCAEHTLNRAPSLHDPLPTDPCVLPPPEPVIAVLRDGRHLVGTLLSYDHFGALGAWSPRRCGRRGAVAAAERGGITAFYFI